MRKTGLMFVLVAAVVGMAACQRSGVADAEAEKPALRAALEKYLSERAGLNLPAMDIEFKDVKIDGATAEAQVEFRAKDGQGAMEMTYTFDRQGGAWVVRGGRSSGTGAAHPEPGAPPAGSSPMPPGHPPLTPPEQTPPPEQR